MPLSHYYATILDADMPPRSEYYDCALISLALETARSKTDWQGGKTLRRRDRWRRTVVQVIRIVHVPTGQRYSAKIYRMRRAP